MDVEELRKYCLSLPHSSEHMPFDDSTLVFKVAGKMFALISLDSSPLRITLKSNPEDAIQLRAEWPAILPGYHMNKKHWNTVIIDGSLSSEFIIGLIDQSHSLVVSTLPKKIQKQINLE